MNAGVSAGAAQPGYHRFGRRKIAPRETSAHFYGAAPAVLNQIATMMATTKNA
jgi:hypothetical protein